MLVEPDLNYSAVNICQRVIETKDLQIEYGGRNAILRDQMKRSKNLADQTVIEMCLSAIVPSGPVSNKARSPMNIIKSFWATIWTEASGFTNSDRARHGKALKEVFSYKAVPLRSIYIRFFHGWSGKDNKASFEAGWSWFSEQRRSDNIFFHLGSGIGTRYKLQGRGGAAPFRFVVVMCNLLLSLSRQLARRDRISIRAKNGWCKSSVLGVWTIGYSRLKVCNVAPVRREDVPDLMNCPILGN